MSKSFISLLVSFVLALSCMACSKSEPVSATATESYKVSDGDPWLEVEAQFNSRNYNQAADMATALMESEGASVRGLTLRGVSYAKINKPYWAFYDLIDATKIERSANTLMNLGNALRMFGYCTRAADAYKEALALAPTDPQIIINISSAYLCYGAVADADLNYQKVFNNFPKDAIAYTTAGTLKALQEDYDQARKAAEKAINIDAFYNPAYKVLTIACRGLGDNACVKEAEKQYNSLEGANFRQKRVSRVKK